MSAPRIPPPAHAQRQSPLICLPAEIKHIIFRYCFTADGALTDPLVGCTRPRAEVVTQLGTNVLATCRRIYHETDRRPLFTQNIFRFTTVDRARAFFRCIGTQNSAYVQDVEVDARRLDSKHPGIGREWLQYFMWAEGLWAKMLGSIHEDAPGLKTLRLNFETWPFIPMSRAGLWGFLREMLLHIEGLERIVVVGASFGRAMARREPWLPLHFVGGDDVGVEDLVRRMWNTVEAAGSRKFIRWSRKPGMLSLEVVSETYLSKNEPNWEGPCLRQSNVDPWPENGSCTWSVYADRHSAIIGARKKGINPTAAG